jgi:DNA-binding NtrC family response regulator
MTANPQRSILIVDDQAAAGDSLHEVLSKTFHVEAVADGAGALSALAKKKPDLILLDIALPSADGFELLRQLCAQAANIPVVVLTADATVPNAVRAIKYGAQDFISKDTEPSELTDVVLAVLEDLSGASSREGDDTECRVSQRPALPGGDFGPMVGRSAGMMQLFQQIDQVAGRDSTVLITGESGTGKELVARQIHERSQRARGPFIAINCAAIPETLIESELFGHEKGAFTHAVDRRIGQFELADGGTLFLDEIGELSLAVQVKLLRFLQEQEFFRVGRSKPVRVNVRVVTATNRNLEELVRAKTFRQDLFYRINVINLHMPALRDRSEDVPFLVNHFISKFHQRYDGRALIISAAAQDGLMAYNWPGNVRELENVVESLMALSVNEEVSLADLPRKVREPNGDTSVDRSGGAVTGGSFEEAERRFETEMIVKALKRADFVQTKAAELLGISRRILKYKMDKLGINENGEVVAREVEDEGSGSSIS